MALTISITEGLPAYYPQVVAQDDGQTIYYAPIPNPPPSPPISPAITIEPKIRKLVTAAWQRVEAYIAYRWNVRDVTFIVEGPGEWTPPLRPFVVTTIKVWSDQSWVTATAAPSPLGGFSFDTAGPYQLIGDLGDPNMPPRAVLEAVYRLVEYFKAVDDFPAQDRVVSRFKTNKEYYGKPPFTMLREVERELTGPNWIARAMQQSGAADLLRPWRNLGAR